MSILIPVIYRNMNYPFHIEANIHEIDGNFYKEKLIRRSRYGLIPRSSAAAVDSMV